MDGHAHSPHTLKLVVFNKHLCYALRWDLHSRNLHCSDQYYKLISISLNFRNWRAIKWPIERHGFDENARPIIPIIVHFFRTGRQKNERNLPVFFFCPSWHASSILMFVYHSINSSNLFEECVFDYEWNWKNQTYGIESPAGFLRARALAVIYSKPLKRIRRICNKELQRCFQRWNWLHLKRKKRIRMRKCLCCYVKRQSVICQGNLPCYDALLRRTHCVSDVVYKKAKEPINLMVSGWNTPGCCRSESSYVGANCVNYAAILAVENCLNFVWMRPALFQFREWNCR